MFWFDCKDTHCLAPKPVCYNGICYEKCPFPTFFMPNSSDCITTYDCNEAGRVIFNGTCLKHCPPSHPIFNPRSFYDKQCVVTCPYFDVANDSVCISDDVCTKAGWQIYNHVCLKACPSGTRILTNLTDDTCEKTIMSYVVLGTSVVFLAFVILACIFLLRNPGKRRKKIGQHDEEREPLIHNGYQPILTASGSGSYAPESFDGRQPMDGVYTSPKEMYIGDQPIHDVDTSVKEIDDWDETSVKNIPQLNRVNELVPIGYQDDHIEQFYREDDQLSSIPTVVALKGFQSSDDSMGCSSHGENN